MVAEAASSNSSIHPYENADLEAMLAISKTGVDLISELGSSDKIEKFGGEAAVISRILELVAPVTRLRRASIENDWRLAFDAVDLSAKIDKKRMKLKLQSYCISLHRESRRSPAQPYWRSMLWGCSVEAGTELPLRFLALFSRPGFPCRA